MVQQPEIHVDIRAGGTQLTLVRKDGTKESKPVDLGELTDALSSNVEHDFGLLPRGLRGLSQKGNNITAVVEIPAGVHDLHYAGESAIKGCHLPTALFIFKLFKKTDGRLTIGDTYLFALRNPFVSLQTDPLFHYPAPNVYPDGHRVCWGGALSGITTIKSLAALTTIARRYFSAPFNNDLFRAGDLSNDFPWSEVDKNQALVPGYFNFIREQPFNSAWLRPALPNYSNYSKALRTVRNGGG